MIFKLCLYVLVCIIMLIVNFGGMVCISLGTSPDTSVNRPSTGAGPRGGPQRESYRASNELKPLIVGASLLGSVDYTSHAFPPGWKPLRFNSTSDHYVRHSGVLDAQFGLADGGGRLFGFV
jgi:amino acid transporter